LLKKVVSDKNQTERVEYGKENVNKSVEDFWSYSIDPISQAVEDVLRDRPRLTLFLA
jgi:hypothetical protein